ncbi:c-type cytochrome [Sediminibacillus albus]|uniref:Cytochrome c551 n=1 Tax=Sediminibacillus albus TaxID=407036 RepID=A0A1G8YNM4_9BACI|nr:cytochrome c [Sediminibacillus albus]SDK04378.1 cytochrome c551 [Sediminibacillus albus]
MRKLLLGAICGIGLMLTACGSSQESDESAQSSDGNASEEVADSGNSDGINTQAAEEEYKKSCQSCHGADLSGAVGPDLTEVGSKYSEEEILEIIEKGKGGMPPGRAAGEDAALLAAWLAEKE